MAATTDHVEFKRGYKHTTTRSFKFQTGILAAPGYTASSIIYRNTPVKQKAARRLREAVRLTPDGWCLVMRGYHWNGIRPLARLTLIYDVLKQLERKDHISPAEVRHAMWIQSGAASRVLPMFEFFR